MKKEIFNSLAAAFAIAALGLTPLTVSASNGEDSDGLQISGVSDDSESESTRTRDDSIDDSGSDVVVQQSSRPSIQPAAPQVRSSSPSSNSGGSSQVPEPATMLLAGLGLGSLAYARIRGRKRSLTS